MYERFFTPPQTSFFLFGPRGTGKSTWLKQRYPTAFWVDLLDPEKLRFFAAGPERLSPLLAQAPETTTIVIDEIQKIPELLDVVHSLIEQKKGYQFILTGSSSRKLKRQGVNLLAGRALLRYMPPFFAKELGSSFDLPRQLRLGMLPIVLDSPSPEEVLRAYVGIYLKEEVQDEGIIRNVGDFARFLEVMSFSHGSSLNTSNISRECQVSRKTVDGFLSVLDDLLLSFQLQIFRHKAKRVLADHPKFYFFDPGVYASLRPKALYDKETEREGPALEGLVGQHLRAWTQAQIELFQLHFWRTASQVEVDFILTGPSCFLAIEVKNGTVIHPEDLRGLETFSEDHPEATPILLYRGKYKLKQRNILCYPVDEFLLQIDPRKEFPSFL